MDIAIHGENGNYYISVLPNTKKKPLLVEQGGNVNGEHVLALEEGQ